MSPRKKQEPVRWPGLYRTTPKFAHCRECDAMVLYSWSEGLELRCDITPVSQVGEAVSLIEGRTTYMLVGKQLYRRTAHLIKTQPTPIIGIVLREHYCGSAEVPQFLVQTRIGVASSVPDDPDAPPPF